MINATQIAVGAEISYTAQGFAGSDSLDGLDNFPGLDNFDMAQGKAGNFRSYMNKALVGANSANSANYGENQTANFGNIVNIDETVPQQEPQNLPNLQSLQKLFFAMNRQNQQVTLIDENEDESMENQELMSLLALQAFTPTENQPETAGQLQGMEITDTAEPLEMPEHSANGKQQPELGENHAFEQKSAEVANPQNLEVSKSAELQNQTSTDASKLQSFSEVVSELSANSDKTEKPEELQNHAKQTETSQKPQETAQTEKTLEVPQKSQTAQTTNNAKTHENLKALFGKLTAAEDNETQNPQKTEQDFSFPQAKIDIKAKPEEMKQLLERFNSVNSANSENSEITEETPKDEKQSETENVKFGEQLFKAHDLKHEPKATLVTEKPTLPTSQIAKIGELIAKQSVKNGTTTLEMVLNPEELGKISIKLVVKNSVVTAEITAEKAKTAELLQNAQNKIMAAVEKNDVKFESITVEHRPDYSEQRDNQGQNQGRQGKEHEDTDGEIPEDGISFSELMASM